MTEPGPPNPVAPTEEGRQIGVDQWVAQADERKQRASGPAREGRSPVADAAPGGKLALLTPAIVVPFLLDLRTATSSTTASSS